MLTGDAIRLGIHPSCKKNKEPENTDDEAKKVLKPEVKEGPEIIIEPLPDKPIVMVSKKLKMKELRAIAKPLGIKTPVGTTKEDLINLINEKRG